MSTRLTGVFRANVRARMAELGMNQLSLAAKLNRTQSHVSQVLSGHRGAGFSTLDAFASALGVSPTDLLDEKILSKVG